MMWELIWGAVGAFIGFTVCSWGCYKTDIMNVRRGWFMHDNRLYVIRAARPMEAAQVTKSWNDTKGGSDVTYL